MKEHTDATLTALIEAMHRNEPDTFIELVNNCHDLFGHDAAGHSLMWHARQSSNPVFAETLEILAAGKPFTEAETVVPDSSDDKDDYSSNAEPEVMPEPIVPAAPAAPSENKEEGKTISVAKLGWAAAVILLTLLVSAYPFFVKTDEVFTEDDVSLRLAGCYLNVMNAWVALRLLLKPSSERRVPCYFVPLLFISLVLVMGGLRIPHGESSVNGADIWVPYSVLLLLSVAHICYYFRNSEDKNGNIGCSCLGIFLLAVTAAVYLEAASREFHGCFFGVVTIIPFFFLGCMLLGGFVEDKFPEEDDDVAGTCGCSGVIIGVYGFCAAVIPHIWYGTIYTVAEFATYHDMPAVVDFCMPDSTPLSMLQEMHVGSGRQWPKDALRFAVQQGDARSAKAYLRFMGKRYILNELACEFNLRPLKEVWPTDLMMGKRYLDLGAEAIEKQISFDEPEMLELLMNKDERVCIDAMMKHNAQKDALWLIQSNGCNATYGRQYAEKRTLLQAAVEKNSLKMVELLMQYGADPDFAKSGKTPRQMAEEKKWGYALKLFKENGVKSSASGASTEPDYGKLLLGE